MTQPQQTDRSARIILIGLIALAVVTIGMTVVATMTEWAMPPLEDAASEAPAATQAE